MCSCTVVKVEYGAVYKEVIFEGRALYGSACVPSEGYYILASAAVGLGMQRYARFVKHLSFLIYPFMMF